MHAAKMACCLLLAAGAAQAEDAAGIDRLNFRGDALTLELSADAGKPYKLDMEKRNWSDQHCKVSVNRQGGELTFLIDLGAVASDRCGLVIKGNVKPGKRVTADLQALNGKLSGQFDRVSLRGHALDMDLKGKYKAVALEANAVKGELRGDMDELKAKGDALNLAFEGASRAVALDGQAVKAKLKLLGAQPAASVEAHGQMVKLDLRASRQAKLDYQVQGQASKVDGDWANTPGAPLKLRVSGQAVKVSLDQD
ncbi:hypothetical protein [Chromobacterium alticapitis]|uniref:Adhesin domain-containing protein n=1 Tax=Chromobacterium alticapitis TaxID=2073169 RepID=A0A2S5DHI4_9NEIS|nr:hypothetical protein [Chromobacterium alticapitis]POZ62462.1 hypothetical protein C2I19_08175 [Chromobacterium alticapitis]